MKYFSLLLLFFFISCKDELKETPENDDNNLGINTIILNTMNEWYLWEEYIADTLYADKNTDPFDFFEKCTYRAEDRWSSLSDDYYETKDNHDGISSSAGYEFQLAFTSKTSLIGIITFVFPNSPAEKLGMYRGQLFTKINNTAITKYNYTDLLDLPTSYTLDLAYFRNKTIYPDRTVEVIEEQNFHEYPILIDTIYEFGEKRIGYLFYTSFIDTYNDDLSIVFNNFKSKGITDLIIDLRYNLGGKVTAEEHLANLIAPKSALGEIFAKEHWNASKTKEFKRLYGEKFFTTHIKEEVSNINLQGKLIGLTSGSTASASEGLLNGLAPLLDFTQIGTKTHGKYTGMIVLPDNDKDPQWAIIPIVMKATNKDDVSVRGGMEPDIELEDNPFDGYQLGNIRETMLSAAINEITGTPTTRSNKEKPYMIGETIGIFRDGRIHKAKPLESTIDTKSLIY